ncbi:hypothetical protein [Streptomyces sp. XH2]|uniref:hypothetical protein n=1 Tax=Streptomyces sp. XH2 TaxID=3412483 RepID=UPI003C7B2012
MPERGIPSGSRPTAPASSTRCRTRAARFPATIFWTPATPATKRNAERLIDRYCYQPKAAVRLAAAISCAVPVAGLRDGLAKTGKAPAGNSLIVPSAAMTAKAHAFHTLTTAEGEAFEAAFSGLAGA